MPDPLERVAEVSQPESCPHVNLNDARCSDRFSLGRLDQAFSVCFGSYRGCPMYHRINAERNQKGKHVEGREHPLIEITARGEAIALRPTGS